MATKLEKEIILRMDGKTTFGKIGQHFGLSYQTIKAIATANGIERPKSISKLKKDKLVEQKILNLLDGTISRTDIAKKLKVSVGLVSRISKKYGIRFDGRSTRALTDRNNEIVELIRTGLTYKEIGDKMGVSKQRIWQFAKANDISKWEISRKKNKLLAESIKNDYKNGVPYQEMKDKYGKDIVGSGLAKQFRDNRDSIITNEFKSGTIAKVIITMDKDGLESPINITAINSVYNVNRRNGVKRYPMIGDRSKGDTFEDKKIIRYIIKKRDKDSWTFIKIANKLNRLGHTTITGKEFNMPNVLAKYNYHKNKHTKK